MSIVQNKFKNYQVNPNTEILILGTFSHDVVDGADFFFGKARNFLWHLLPICYNLPSLKEATLKEKQDFMLKYKIDFADLIATLDVPEGEENNLDDTFIDTHASEWKDIPALIAGLSHLKAVYFTRKTFNGIANTKKQIALTAQYCLENKIRFCKLETPAKFFSPEKQQQWIDTIVKQKTCMKL
jgi:G:T/U-mismatch repair DNA glycosylase